MRKRSKRTTPWRDHCHSRHVDVQRDINTANANSFYNGCPGKVRHASKRQALGAKRVMLNKSSSYDDYESVDALVAYACVFCGNWHLGHATRTR